MDSSDDAKLNDTMEPMGKEQLTTRLSEISRKSVDESRQQGRTTTITKRRFGKDLLKQTDETLRCQTSKRDCSSYSIFTK